MIVDERGREKMNVKRQHYREIETGVEKETDR